MVNRKTCACIYVLGMKYVLGVGVHVYRMGMNLHICRLEMRV